MLSLQLLFAINLTMIVSVDTNTAIRYSLNCKVIGMIDSRNCVFVAESEVFDGYLHG